ncbi:MarR family transcriptional regulator [Paenibacillus sp. JCM 10914]|uniref:MarR family winged helix-turn-helix transcriptional regulator n=1 Tax=Paenibacillus sp. JCM 10914 TaxID=1236974 RepID=UPI0003CC5FF2|nr:MarR family winged helix-turn-helix transcriptional regulator [Paenibacillus sp. JCM 10914]GAE06695.1 transcriptional regulator, MarR family [Paenibacillus sp. JCM 10914]
MNDEPHLDLHTRYQDGEAERMAKERIRRENNHEGSIANRLLHSIRMFQKQEWDQQMISGHTPGEIRVLIGLKRCGRPDGPGMKVSEISEMMNVTSPTITQFINALECKGLVERVMDQRDRRVVRVQMTAAGEEVVTQAFANLHQHFNGLVEYLGEEASVKLTELLTKVYEYKAQAGKNKQTSEDE